MISSAFFLSVVALSTSACAFVTSAFEASTFAFATSCAVTFTELVEFVELISSTNFAYKLLLTEDAQTRIDVKLTLNNNFFFILYPPKNKMQFTIYRQ